MGELVSSRSVSVADSGIEGSGLAEAARRRESGLRTVSGPESGDGHA